MGRPDIDFGISEGGGSPENAHAKGSSFVSFREIDLPLAFARNPPQTENDTQNLIYIELEMEYED